MEVIIVDEGSRYYGKKIKSLIPEMRLLDINNEEEDRERIQV